MQKLKKFITLLLVAVMCLSLLPATVLAENEEPEVEEEPAVEEPVEEEPAAEEEPVEDPVVEEPKEEEPAEEEPAEEEPAVEEPVEEEPAAEEPAEEPAAEEAPVEASATGDPEEEEFDIESAKVQNIVFEKEEFKVPETCAVTVSCGDNITGIASGKITLRNTKTDTILATELVKNGSALTGSIVTDKENTTTGEYIVATVYLEDANGNKAYFFGKGDKNYSLSAEGNRLAAGLDSKSVLVSNPFLDDKEPPVIVSIDVPETVNAGESFSVKIKAVDLGTGISEKASVSFKCAYTEKELSGELTLSGEDTLSGSINVPANYRGGFFIIKNIYIKDNAGNSIWYFGKGDSNFAKAADNLKLSTDLRSTAVTVYNKQDIPVITYAQCVNGGIKLNWGKVSGVTSYNVQYKVKGVDDEWNDEATVKGLAYTFKELYSSGEYIFRVCCVSPIPSDYSAEKSVIYLEAPVIKSIQAVSESVQLTWDEVTGAEEYKVMYKQNGKSWKTLGTTEALSLTSPEGTILKGVKYTFKVLCSKPVESKASAEKTFTMLAAPAITAKAVKNGVKLTWKAVKGASGYTVEVSDNGTDWKAVAKTSAKSYTVTSLKTGVTYSFRVKCYKPNDSEYSNVEEMLWIAAPKLLKLKKVNTTRTLTWNKVDGAEGYVIYRRRAGKTWQKIGEVAGDVAIFEDSENPKFAANYYYTVAALVGTDEGPYNEPGLGCRINAKGK